jgi:hypothetical protein
MNLITGALTNAAENAVTKFAENPAKYDAENSGKDSVTGDENGTTDSSTTDEEVKEILMDEKSKNQLVNGFIEALLTVLNTYSTDIKEITLGRLLPTEVKCIDKNIINDLLNEIYNEKYGRKNPASAAVETKTDTAVVTNTDANTATADTAATTATTSGSKGGNKNNRITGGVGDLKEVFEKEAVQEKIFIIFCKALHTIFEKDTFKKKIFDEIFSKINVEGFKKRIIMILKNALYKNKNITSLMQKSKIEEEQSNQQTKDCNEKEQNILRYIAGFNKTLNDPNNREKLTSISAIIDRIIVKPPSGGSMTGGTLGETPTSQFNAFHFHKFPLDLYTLNILKCPVQKLGYRNDITIKRKYAKLGLVSTIAKPLYNLATNFALSNECAYPKTKRYQQQEHFNHLRVYDDKGDHIIILYRDIMLKMIKFKNIIESVNSQRKDEKYERDKDGITKTFNSQQNKKVRDQDLKEPECNDTYIPFTYNYSEYLKSALASTRRGITGHKGSLGFASWKSDLKYRITISATSTIPSKITGLFGATNKLANPNIINESLNKFKDILHRDKLCIRRLNNEYTICVFYEEKDGPLYTVFIFKKVSEYNKFGYNTDCLKKDGNYNHCIKDIVIFDPDTQRGNFKTSRTAFDSVKTTVKNKLFSQNNSSKFEKERVDRYYSSSEYMISFSRNELFVSFLFYLLFYELNHEYHCRPESNNNEKEKAILKKIFFLHYFDNILYKNYDKLVDANNLIKSLPSLKPNDITTDTTYTPPSGIKNEELKKNKALVEQVTKIKNDINKLIFQDDIEIDFSDKRPNRIDLNETYILFNKYKGEASGNSQTPEEFLGLTRKGGLIQHKHLLANKQTQKHIIYKKVKPHTLKNTNRSSTTGNGVLLKNGRNRGIGKVGKTQKNTRFQRPRRQTKHRVKN